VASYQKLLGVPAFAKAPNLDPLEAVRFGPTLEFNGIGGGYQGEGSKTVIPSRAFAKITCRLVAHQDSLAIQEALCRAIEQRCPAAVKLSIRRGACADAYQVSPPHKSPHDSAASPRLRKAFAAVDAAIEAAFGKAPLYLREGGSIPVIADFKKQAGLDAIMVGLFTPKDNLHAPDESFDLALMQRGITAFASIFQQIAQQA
jgi:acetylornithine deacetylase/succinyl-diaminopimelate desuccinylase-like protein